MIENDFYPTPDELADKLLEGIDPMTVTAVLEPSAGSGNLLKALERVLKRTYRSYWNNTEVEEITDCIEIDTSLANMLCSQGYRVVCDDFLQYHTIKVYSHVIMNPPFSDGAAHLLHAIELVSPYGGEIRCILNANTLKNRNTRDKERLYDLLTDEYEASIEYMEGAFTRSERPTDVEIAMIKFKVPMERRPSFIIDGLEKAAKESDRVYQRGNEVAPNDFIDSLVQEYEYAAKLGMSLLREYGAVSNYLKTESGTELLHLNVAGSKQASPNVFLQELRALYWSKLFGDDHITRVFTNKLLEEYTSQITKLRDYEFNYYNIYTIRLALSNSMGANAEQAVEELFWKLSGKYGYRDDIESGNVHYYNGWCTNKAWGVGKKAIIPFHQAVWSFCGHYNPTNYYVLKELSDMEKTLNYIDGKTTVPVNIQQELIRAEKNEITRKIPLKYFNVTFYKKGTIHLDFSEHQDIITKLNIYVGRKKNWLPPSYGKVTYEDLEPEARAVVDSFQERAEYDNVVARRDEYLVESPAFLQIQECTSRMEESA